MHYGQTKKHTLDMQHEIERNITQILALTADGGAVLDTEEHALSFHIL